jgi:hypothetical protein
MAEHFGVDGLIEAIASSPSGRRLAHIQDDPAALREYVQRLEAAQWADHAGGSKILLHVARQLLERASALQAEREAWEHDELAEHLRKALAG